ncbi:MAG TPA: S9 family peptidase [Blastocatellia bacterium]|nr:S9 family peptidase [Blastocatellia bacterium]
MKKLVCVLSLITTLYVGANMTFAQDDSMPVKPPVAKKEPKTTTIHGETLVDDYFWLRDRNINEPQKMNPEIIRHLEAENAWTAAVMKPTEAFQASLYEEMLARIKETDVNVPYREGNYFYYTRTEQGKQYPIVCRKKGSTEAGEEIMLDVNELAKGKAFMSLGSTAVSNDGNLLAWTSDDLGFRQYKLNVKDLRTGLPLPDTAERITSLAWANDNRTIFFTTEDPVTKRSDKFFRHRLGEKQSELLYEEKDELYRIFCQRSRSHGYIFLTSASSTTSEVRYVSADRPNEAPKVVAPRRDGHEYYLEHHGDLFYIRTNDRGKNFRLVTAPVKDPQQSGWKELIAHRDKVMLEDVDCFASYYVASERENGVPQLLVTEIKSGQSHHIEMPEPVYVAGVNVNREFNTTTLRFSYESLVTPNSVFDYDMKTRQRRLMKQQEVLGGYDPKQYQSERIYATASDGTKIPISVVYKKGTSRDGQHPLLLEGYGSYGISNDVDFSSARISLLDRGLIFAVAHIRGGGELGKEWHDQGKMMKKKNTFTDFITCAEYLISEKYTSKDRLAITGGSAGGLLMGAVTNMRPDLFKVVMSYVPFVDVMNTMLDATLPLTVGEYLEWGNPNEQEAYRYMKSWSPYDNIEAKAYPTMLVRTSLNDSQVMYWEPAKYVAKLRAMKTDNNPLLFKIRLVPGGHGGASGRYDRLKDTAFDYAFLLSQFGITK